MNKEFRKFFPIFKNNPELIYLDNAATAQICDRSIEAMNDYQTKYRSNIHRSFHELSQTATNEYENSRKTIAEFLNSQTQEVIFNSGTTAGLNMLCQALSPRLSHRDNVVITIMDHHSNLVPWLQASKHFGFELRYIELTKNYELDLNSASMLIDQNTKIVSFPLISNVLGTISPANEIISLAKKVNAFTIIDAAQGAGRFKIDVQDLNCDFLVFSGHKTYGPTGIGVLFGKQELLKEIIAPVNVGGSMVSEVERDKASWADIPYRFEPGTPNIAGAIGLGAAIKFINEIGITAIQQHEKDLTKYALEQLTPEVNIFGPHNLNRAGIISFWLENIHPHDVAEVMNRNYIALRAGFHCAEPLHRTYNLLGTTRLSFSIYNSISEIDEVVSALKELKKIFAYV